MSNFIKGGYVTVAGDKKITINSNDFVEKRLEELRSRIEEEPAESIKEGFSEGLDPLLVERLVADPEEEGNVIKGAPTPEEMGRMVEEARAEAERIVAEAKREADEIRGAARDDGMTEGYNDGIKKAEEECRLRYEARERECEERARAAEAEYEKKRAQLEPLLVEKLSEIFSRVTGARLENDRDTVLYLLNRSLTGVESGRNYIVHVSSSDFDNVKAHKEDVLRGSGLLSENVEIVEDGTLSSGGCLIESEGGIWDCSLGTQLALLSQQLKILSYE